MKHDQERTIIYHRKEIELDSHVWPFQELSKHGTNNRYIDTDRTVEFQTIAIIGFCGKIYPVLTMHRNAYSTNYDLKYKEPISTHCYTIEEVMTFLKANLKQNVMIEFMDKKKYDRYRLINYFNYKELVMFFEEMEKKRSSFGYLFDDHPVFSFEKQSNYPNILIKNCKLKSWGFERIVPPYEAYQELLMWMNNKAVPEKSIPVMDNKTKIHAAGFNLKTSFRKGKNA